MFFNYKWLLDSEKWLTLTKPLRRFANLPHLSGTELANTATPTGTGYSAINCIINPNMADKIEIDSYNDDFIKKLNRIWCRFVCESCRLLLCLQRCRLAGIVEQTVSWDYDSYSRKDNVVYTLSTIVSETETL
ncbi:unnamed protein product [Ambrosiozyma monospora]|uniref:Unnamed protein product n=1 Tax=Ambrosiozyma monospora TaxID=43982 RepID=A0ACB5T304_AMBMO|nr:unnamed protein product [Ambrosiozyma monospora]